MRKKLEMFLKDRLNQALSGNGDMRTYDRKWDAKQQSLQKRSAEVVKILAAGAVRSLEENGNEILLRYGLHYKYVVKQKNSFFIEEGTEERQARFLGGELVHDEEILPPAQTFDPLSLFTEDDPIRLSYRYDRLKAVQYAERWWNEFNPAYPRFNDDCTNFISQCLHAGGIPMWGMPNRNRGLWIKSKSWSYSWTGAHAFKQLMAGSGGLKTKEVHSPQELLLGDIICIDFQGNGRYDHSLIVTAKDAEGMPLVNAHTTNSRNRYWAYEDSTAYTPNIQYKFYSIVENPLRNQE
ncbi:Putative amidase domain-containing protein [Bacillus sp. OV322]|uniref:amidase domain-containing protein n=1 Tax=Bacillus sp. OV322 TaxID=1882764 RepID=UPI0008E90864|nr:amidase domain-containing protein [Bacillus sp. OV322]SFB92674.1 Putative amidase domain-containing protein [Bacillus sp. OV322]